MKKVFSLYNDWDKRHLYNNNAQTLRQYTDIINENMNIAFFVPKKDFCDFLLKNLEEKKQLFFVINMSKIRKLQENSK